MHKYRAALICSAVIIAIIAILLFHPHKEQVPDTTKVTPSKILMCGGTNLSGRNTWGKLDANHKMNVGWTSIDTDVAAEPTMIADLTKAKTWNKFETTKTDIILDEFCPYNVSSITHKYAAKALNPGGMLLSKICTPFKQLPAALNELKQLGFSKVMVVNWTQPSPHTQTALEIFNLPEHQQTAYEKEKEKWWIWLKTADPQKIREYFDNYSKTHKMLPDLPNTENICFGPEPGESFEIVAIR